MESKRRLTTIPVPVLISVVSADGHKLVSKESALKELGRVFLWEDNGPAHTQAEEFFAVVLDGEFSPRSKCIALHCLTHKDAHLLTTLAKKALAEFLTSANPEHKEII
ncbi:MAG: hypothetical protein UV60_C0027G0003 [Parcubacteria group bacterium GW2011_GWA2_43_11]|nr:MAG: hypothetical protein UV60_C0027G0003 [Parcubacteria group bacterium GW2011_GWA2_43_11]